MGPTASLPGVVHRLDKGPVYMCNVYIHRLSEDEFLRGHRHKQYNVRRTEMVVGGRGRVLNLGYMERLLDSSSPLSSLPTPAQLCRKHNG